MSIPEPSINVIFGGTGDLARRKLLPALARLAGGGLVHPTCRLVAVAIEPHDDAGFRAMARDALHAAGVAVEDAARLCGDHMHYHSIGKAGADDFAALAGRLAALEQEHGLAGNRAFYL